MSLLSEAMEKCIMMNKTTVPDGYGGRKDVWSESDFLFDAAIVFDTSVEARKALAEKVMNMYTVTTKRGIALSFHDVFKRSSDGKIFRVTSDGKDKHTPQSAGLNMEQVTAEEWSLPNG